MGPEVVCVNCGARSAEPRARFCPRCGSELPREGAPPREEAAPPAPADRAARFRALRAHPGFAEAARRAPPGGGGGSLLGHALSVLLLLCLGFILLIPSLAFPPVAVAVVAAFGFGIAYVVASAARGGRWRRAPLVRVPACVTGERTELAGGEGGGMRTRYYLSLESERGTREEYEVEDKLAAQVAPGDLGVATFAGEALVDFVSIPI